MMRQCCPLAAHNFSAAARACASVGLVQMVLILPLAALAPHPHPAHAGEAPVMAAKTRLVTMIRRLCIIPPTIALSRVCTIALTFENRNP
jgi:hypothetical protein